jgi:hypothetical protein
MPSAYISLDRVLDCSSAVKTEVIEKIIIQVDVKVPQNLCSRVKVESSDVLSLL